MIFRTFDHYYNDDILLNKEDVCFICYDFLNVNETPIKLNSKTYYFKNCNCDGFIHKKCFDKWYDTNHSCPVCRILVTKNKHLTTQIFVTNSYFSITCSIFFHNISKINKCLFFMFLIYFTTEIYYQGFNKILNQYDSKYDNFNETY